MKKIVIALFVLVISVMFAQECTCSLTYVQSPDPNGVDVECMATTVADDWTIPVTEYVCAIPIWISWQGDVEGTIQAIDVSIYSDVAAGVDLPWSHPGTLLWNHVFVPGDGQTFIMDPEIGDQSFYFPLDDQWFQADHLLYRKVYCGRCNPGECIASAPATNTFLAEADVVYWFVVQITATGGSCGWKTSTVDYNDAAVYYDGITDMIWEPVLIPLYDESVNMAFEIWTDPDSTCPVELSSFDAAVTHSNFVQLNWTTESESDLLGYNVLRSETDNLDEAFTINTEYIAANNSTTQCDYCYTDTDVVLNSTYNYWLESIEMNGSSEFFGPVSVIVEEGGGEPIPDPVEAITMFESVYPNPFNPSTSFKYTLPEAADVTFNVYNLKGQLVETIVDHGVEGSNQVSWDATNQASGIYMVHMNAGNYSSMRKAVLIK